MTRSAKVFGKGNATKSSNRKLIKYLEKPELSISSKKSNTVPVRCISSFEIVNAFKNFKNSFYHS